MIFYSIWDFNKRFEFSKGAVHKTDGVFKGGVWVVFQRGEYTKPMGFRIFFIASRMAPYEILFFV